MSSMFKAGKDKPGASVTSSPKRSKFGEKEKERRGTFLGGLVGHAATAGVAGVGALLGFGVGGPVGALAGGFASAAAAHVTTAFFDSRSSGSASFASIGELKNAVAAQTKSALDTGDNAVNGVKTRLEEALRKILGATDGSGHSSVEEMKGAVSMAISLCDSDVLTASRSAQQQAEAWAGGL